MNTLTRTSAHPAPLPSLLVECAFFMRRSRSLASMLPAFLMSGIASLALSLVLHLPGTGFSEHLASGWLESWLTAWPIAFPVAYVGALLLRKMKAATKSSSVSRTVAGLGWSDFAEVSQQVTAAHCLTVLRGVKATPSYRVS
ncbi:DUF2798 domain-containing protein [Noviherbaspirillum saxi]|uniref:DUF2798 domain-containing protein n=1 Tax=Noviherbaspirillum saxi TaxID=2320863 RepID=A0A3A3G8N3_9BURK|nr:DUF2798 domain-containing protein [Noviherbaspirillum saxi]RJF97249.1 DUF2798 domain-containing protein [Noviherbaspirillum saxi]